MNMRTKLATDLRTAASSFQEGHAIRADLNAMAFALENMSAERFASIVIAAEEPNNAGNSDTPADNGITETTQDKESAVKKANTSVGEYWSKEASERVLHNLVFDIVGSTVKADASSDRPDPVKPAALPAAIVPNGTDGVGVVAEGAEPVPAAALPKEATPEIAESLDSKIVEKAEATPVQKEAAEAPKAGFTQVACGIELASETMGYGVEISAAEQAQLDSLFF